MNKLYNSNNIALKIKQLAKEKNIVIKKMLEDIGLGFNTMSNMKTSMPKADTLARIADYLECPVDYLLDRNIKETTPKEIELYNNLDDLDQAEIRGEIKQMLKADKYKQNIHLPLREADKYGTPPIPLSPRKIAAYGADGTKQINPPNPRKIT